MLSHQTTKAEHRDFHAARRQALIAGILDAVLHQPRELLRFEDVRVRLNVRGQHAIGRQEVPIDHIVGTEGRYADFDRRFLPRSDKLMQRWSSIDRVMLAHGELPPVDLWKIGDIYFVRDGHHRVSVARQLGRQYVDAEVTELLVDVPLTPDLSVRDLLRKEEYSDFLEWTNLHQLRPAERVELTELGAYLDLVRDINARRGWLACRLGREVDRDEAVADWYDHVYMPIVELIRARSLLRHFPRRTEADLYHWIMNHRAELRAERSSSALDGVLRDAIELVEA